MGARATRTRAGSISADRCGEPLGVHAEIVAVDTNELTSVAERPTSTRCCIFTEHRPTGWRSPGVCVARGWLAPGHRTAAIDVHACGDDRGSAEGLL